MSLLGLTSWWPGWFTPANDDTNGHADFDADDPLRLANRMLRNKCVTLAVERDDARDDAKRWHIKARDLGRAYGRASATIGEQRGTIASLRAQLAAALSNDEASDPAVEWSGGVGTSRPVGSGADQPGPPAGGALGSGPPAGTDDEVAGMPFVTGWLTPPPAGRVAPRDATNRTAAVAQLLVDHELLADDTCRCGWGHLRLDPIVASCPPDCPDGPLWHADHVAEQLAAHGLTP